MSATLLQAIVQKCAQQTTTNDSDYLEGRAVFAQEVLDLIDKSKIEVKGLPPADPADFQGLRLERPLVILDLETTSKEVGEARIIEIAAVKHFPDGTREVFQALVHPGFPLSPEIIEITGITDADLEGQYDFAHYAPILFAFLQGADFCGYGGRNYDAPVLWEEFNRVGCNWEISQDEILDPMEIFYQREPRTLTGAMRYYLNADHSHAHRAMPDVEAATAVLLEQLREYVGTFVPVEVEEMPVQIPTVAQLIRATKPDRRVDMAGKIVLNDEGVPCYSFGDGVKGKPVLSNIKWARWMLSKSFPEQTKRVLKIILVDYIDEGFSH